MYTLKNTTLTLTDEQVEEVVKNAGKKEFIKEGQEYWYLYWGGQENCTWQNDNIDKARLARANVYLTEKEAKKADNKRLALGTIQAYIRDNGLEFTPDWKDTTDKYQIIGWNYVLNNVNHGCSDDINYSQHNLIFKSAEDLQKVLDNCREELIVLLT
jgi:hypothetical protein